MRKYQIDHVLPPEGEYSYLEIFLKNEFQQNELIAAVEIEESEELKFIFYPVESTFELSINDMNEIWERVQKFHREALQVAKDNRRIFGDDW